MPEAEAQASSFLPGKGSLSATVRHAPFLHCHDVWYNKMILAPTSSLATPFTAPLSHLLVLWALGFIIYW